MLMVARFRLALYLIFFVLAARCAALAQTAVFDQTPVPNTSTNKSENVLQSYAVPGGTIYQGFFRSPGAVPTWSSGMAFAPAMSSPQQAYNAIATSLTVNDLPMTAASLTGGSVLTVFNYTATTSSSTASTWTLPSVAAVVAAMKAAGINPAAGMTYELDLYNDQGTGTRTFTLTADTGATWTLAGTAQTIANATMRRYLVTLTTLTAGTMQSMGEFTITAAP